MKNWWGFFFLDGKIKFFKVKGKFFKLFCACIFYRKIYFLKKFFQKWPKTSTFEFMGHNKLTSRTTNTLSLFRQTFFWRWENFLAGKGEIYVNYVTHETLQWFISLRRKLNKYWKVKTIIATYSASIYCGNSLIDTRERKLIDQKW
jgi:hypothetical protein